eukprot:CAMPEP_0174895182 /NCGR_PEP_ID=MMETSP0167-20121228/9649_1 /TAXON_ID=38298 /ORGANISM="Rhodella maculata, Strain CCMP736" /LENGTH=131 /DNA_ID=CAMNT_0016134451 /DNA_START=1005 /DNA_END=1399 /DNA_ORIENTATION=+
MSSASGKSSRMTLSKFSTASLGLISALFITSTTPHIFRNLYTLSKSAALPFFPDKVPHGVHVVRRTLCLKTRSDVLGDLLDLHRRLKPLDPLRVDHTHRRPRKRPVLGKVLRARPSTRANLGANERLTLEG